jgi:kinesin family member 5
MALTTAGSKHIPFRNSKLTLILKESLGGNSKTTLLCTASRRKIHNEESAQTLYFASRAKAIKNNCKTNVQLGVKELQYLADHMKKEILTLRGQLKKGGINYNVITDPKLLAIISNSEFDGGDDEGETNSLNDDDLRKRRISLLNLTEKDIIIKYCELRAKFDNLLENAGNKIYQLNQARTETNPDVSGEMNSLKIETDEKLKQIVESKDLEINQLLEKIEFVRKEADQKVEQLNKTNQEMFKSKLIAEEELENSKKDYDSLQEMFNLTQNDISFFQEKLTKKKTKNSGYKEEIKSLKELNSKQLESVEELNKKISDHESKNLESKQKIEELSNKNELLVLEVENLKNQLKQKEENETFQMNKNRELGEEINRGLENILSKEKRINELLNQISEVEMKNKNEVESLQKKEGYALAEIEALKKENENLNKMMQDKISDQSILAEKEKILNEVKSTLEMRINDLTTENERIKSELLDTVSKFNTEKSELNFTIDNLNVELKNRLSEKESLKFEYESLKKNSEENLKNEQQKSEQLQIKLDASEKRNYEFESNILILTESEKKITAEKSSLEKEVKEKSQLFEEANTKNNLINEKLEKSEKEIRELRDSLLETKNKSLQESEAEKKKYSSDIAELKSQFEFKSKKVEDGERKINELKAEIKVLQNSNQNLQKRLNEVELDHSRVKRQSIILQKEVQSIKKEAPLNKNIFGVLLKKTGDTNNFLKSAIQETKNIQKRTEDIFQDKIDELKKFRENIVSLSPKTVSSRCK